MSKAGNDGGSINGAAEPPLLSIMYPVNSFMELTLASDTNATILRGLIYCTDEISNTIVLKKSLVHTTLSSEITLVNARNVVQRKIIFDYNNNNTTTTTNTTNAGEVISGSGSSYKSGKGIVTTTLKDENNNNNNNANASNRHNIMDDSPFTEEQAREMAGVHHLDELKLPLPHVSAKILEERERRALRLAEESLSHINQGASPTGQKIFDKLLKACNEVVWNGESIVVLKEIRVDPPYTADNCVLIKGSRGSGSVDGAKGGVNSSNGGSRGLDEHSLERVKKIVSAATMAM